MFSGTSDCLFDNGAKVKHVHFRYALSSSVCVGSQRGRRVDSITMITSVNACRVIRAMHTSRGTPSQGSRRTEVCIVLGPV